MTIIDSVSAFGQQISELNEGLLRDGELHNEILLFRGQSDEKFELLPSIARNKNFLLQERNLIEMAKYRLPDVFRNSFSPVELLALLQHHGIPTRLLDVTENALVALYFACAENSNTAGEVIVFKENELDVVNYPIVDAIADSYRFVRTSYRTLETFYATIKNQPYFLEQSQATNRCYKTDKDGGEWISKCCKTPFFIYAPIRTQRQQAQSGRYILFPNDIDYRYQRFVPRISGMPKEHECIIEKILIKNDNKKKVLSELALFGVSRRTLFCDNIDIICESIREQFG